MQIPGVQKGTYALAMHARLSRRIQIGRLGTMALVPGFYLYVGSAFGSGGLKARLNHHSKRVTKAHWHIDYLRRYTRIVDIWYTTDSIRREEGWVGVLQGLNKFNIPMHGFGASDGMADSHLFCTCERPDFEEFHSAVMKSFPGHAPLFRTAKSVLPY